MPTKFVRMLMHATQHMGDDEYNEAEAMARSALIDQCVNPGVGLSINEDSANHCYTPADGFLYIGSHSCQEHDESDGASIDLIAFGPDVDDPSNEDCDDFLGWHFKTVYDENLHADISYCPYCGVHLSDFITNHLVNETQTID